MLEKRFVAVPNQYILADGTSDGIITVPDASLFKVKQEVYIGGNTLPNLNEIEVKRVLSSTQIAIGPKKGNIDSRTDLSAYTLAKNSFIASNEQKRPSVPLEEFSRAMYEEEPTVAQRTILVDKYGNKYDENNPLPVNAIVEVGDVNVSLDGYDKNFPDSINITGTEDGTKTGTKHGVRVDSEGTVSTTKDNSLITKKHDEMDITRDVNGKISSFKTLRSSTIQESFVVTRDIDGRIINVKRS